jgi:hypothetical protein
MPTVWRAMAFLCSLMAFRWSARSSSLRAFTADTWADGFIGNVTQEISHKRSFCQVANVSVIGRLNRIEAYGEALDDACLHEPMGV